MAKIVIAGRSDCPYFARIELLGDRLAKNLKKFKLHKIMVQPDQWDKWLKDTCNEKGWNFSKSPIVWRELIDRGGKGVLIGGANEFQEYAKAYYDVESEMNSYDMRTISAENKITKDELDEEEKTFKALSHPVHVCITNASSPVCYHLLNNISSGQVLGPTVELTIRLLVSSKTDIESVTGMAMEAEDLAHGLLKEVKVYDDALQAFENCSIIIFLDEILRAKDETERVWISKYVNLFISYANSINEVALKSCKVLICGNGPLNFNAMVVRKNAPNLARQNIVAVASVIETHAKSVIGERLRVNPAGIVSLIVWGNINGQRYLDVSNCRVHNYDEAIWGPPWFSVSAVEMIHDKHWIHKELPGLVDGRNQKVSDAMSRPTSLSTANAISTTLQYWCRGSPHKQVFSLGVYSEGWYNVPESLYFSLPVSMDPKGYWHVVQDLIITPEAKIGIYAAVKEIEELVAESKQPLTPSHTDEEIGESVGDSLQGRSSQVELLWGANEAAEVISSSQGEPSRSEVSGELTLGESQRKSSQPELSEETSEAVTVLESSVEQTGTTIVPRDLEEDTNLAEEDKPAEDD